jgi:hypothetical protein
MHAKVMACSHVGIRSGRLATLESGPFMMTVHLESLIIKELTQILFAVSVAGVMATLLCSITAHLKLP